MAVSYRPTRVPRSSGRFAPSLSALERTEERLIAESTVRASSDGRSSGRQVTRHVPASAIELFWSSSHAQGHAVARRDPAGLCGQNRDASIGRVDSCGTPRRGGGAG
jgi:hypothetical protein